MATDSLVPQIAEAFKAAYGKKITDNTDLLLVERNLLEFMMLLGRGGMAQVFQDMDGGYEGPVIEKDGRKYRFVDYRQTTLHGLFGTVQHTRAYYHSPHGGEGISRWTGSWASRSGIPRAVSTFCPLSPGAKRTRRV